MKLSIILPVYNVEKYITKSIESVLRQTYPDFELLVIIDGSPDNSKAKVELFEDERIKVYEKTNGGLSDARNYGLERAKGEFIYFMDSDDWIEPNLIEECIAVLEKDKLDIVIFGYIKDYENIDGDIIASKEEIPSHKKVRKGDTNFDIDSHLLGILGYAWNKIYKKSLLVDNAIGFEKGISLVEDIMFNTQVYQNVDQLSFIQKGFYHYLNRPTLSLAKQFNLNSFELKVRKNQCLEQFFNNWNIKNRKEILASTLFQGMKNCMHNLYCTDGGMADRDKLNFVRGMFNHERTVFLINYYRPRNIKEFLLKVCVKYKLVSLFNHVLVYNKK